MGYASRSKILNLFVKVQILAGLPGGNSFKINALGLIFGCELTRFPAS